MAQDYIKINSKKIFQPDGGSSAAYETTYTQGSTRSQSGIGKFTPMFTIERFPYTATDIPAKDVAEIMQMIVYSKSNKKTKFQLHYFSPYYGKWRDDTFYVGQVSDIKFGTLKDGEEKFESFSFNAQRIDPL